MAGLCILHCTEGPKVTIYLQENCTLIMLSRLAEFKFSWRMAGLSVVQCIQSAKTPTDNNWLGTVNCWRLQFFTGCYCYCAFEIQCEYQYRYQVQYRTVQARSWAYIPNAELYHYVQFLWVYMHWVPRTKRLFIIHLKRHLRHIIQQLVYTWYDSVRKACSVQNKCSVLSGSRSWQYTLNLITIDSEVNLVVVVCTIT